MFQIRRWTVSTEVRPLRDTMPCFISSGQKADASGRTHGTRIRLRELHAFAGQPLERRSSIAVVPFATFLGEGNAGVLPAHVIGKDKQNVGARLVRIQMAKPPSKERTDQNGC